MTLKTAQTARSFKAGRTISALILREMASTYGRSVTGYLWAIAEPVAGIVLLTLVFSIALRSPPLGDSFALYYASGFLPFTIFTDIQNKISQAIRFSKPLLFYPGVTYVDAFSARLILNGMTQTMVSIIVFTGIILMFETNVLLDVPAMALAMLMAAALALSIGVLNCFLFWALPPWQNIWSILTRPLFLMSCVFFSFESIPEPYQGWLWFNPLVHVVGQMRTGVYATYDGHYVSHLYVFGLAIGLLTIGLIFLNRFHRDMINT